MPHSSQSQPPRRCPWARGDLMTAYHDREWGVPRHGERELFELLILEGAQAGLSWETILRKRPRYRIAFAGFDPARVAGFGEAEIARLLADAGIVRNRLKIGAAVTNAAAFLAVRREFGGFDRYLWRFAPAPARAPRSAADIPAQTEASARLSRDLRQRGFRFVGPTICYAYMQAAGLVNDHLAHCFRRTAGSPVQRKSGGA